MGKYIFYPKKIKQMKYDYQTRVIIYQVPQTAKQDGDLIFSMSFKYCIQLSNNPGYLPIFQSKNDICMYSKTKKQIPSKLVMGMDLLAIKFPNFVAKGCFHFQLNKFRVVYLKSEKQIWAKLDVRLKMKQLIYHMFGRFFCIQWIFLFYFQS